MIKAIAEHGPGIIDPVLFDIFLAVFNGDEILVHQQGLTLRGKPGEGDADRPVATAEIQAVISGIYRHMLE